MPLIMLCIMPLIMLCKLTLGKIYSKFSALTFEVHSPNTWGVSCFCSNIWNNKSFILHPYFTLSHGSIHPHSAQKDKLSHSTVCCPFLFGLLLKWQDHYHKGQLLPLGNICMSASLSASFSVSICHSFIVFYPCFLAPSFMLPNTVCHSFSHGKVDQLWETLGVSCLENTKYQKKVETKMFLM